MKCSIDAFELVCPYIDRLPSDSYTYMSRNQICSTNWLWLDHVITSKNDIVTNVYNLYGYTIEDHIPVKFELMPPPQETYFENALTDPEIIEITYQWNKVSESESFSMLKCSSRYV